MAVTRANIAMWFDRGREDHATHMIVVCDRYDWDDYPVYVMAGEQVRERYLEIETKPMQHVMEVYDLSLPKTEQLNETRAFHL